jgi:hypothetical protein
VSALGVSDDRLAVSYREVSENLLARARALFVAGPGSLEEGLRELANAVESHPALARALVLEVHYSGGGALSRRQELVELLAAELDRAFEVSSPSDSCPSTVSLVLVGALEWTLAEAVLAGRVEDLSRRLFPLAAFAREALAGSRLLNSHLPVI